MHHIASTSIRPHFDIVARWVQSPVLFFFPDSKTEESGLILTVFLDIKDGMHVIACNHTPYKSNKLSIKLICDFFLEHIMLLEV